jgi:hypothetical protein
VVYAGAGQLASDFPANTAGKIVLMDYSTNATTRNNAVTAAVAQGAVAVILANATGTGAPPSFTLTTARDMPILGGGAAHSTWIRELLAQGPLTLRIATNRYVTPMGTNVIATRHAVNDPTGTTAPIVMVGAHIDSVLGAPGAHDDASGNGVSLEIARVLSQYPLDKELRIGGFGGEEGGLLGARAYAATLTEAEKARFVGEWQMDMVGTPYGPAKLWALTPDGRSNSVVQSAYDAAERDGFDGLQNCKLGQSDHQAFFDIGIPSSLFIWLDYRAPADCVTGRGTYVTEPEYHRPTDTMDNISQERLQITLDVVGGAVAWNALNAVSVNVDSERSAHVAGAIVQADCGDGWRDLGVTGTDGVLDTVVPHATCTFRASSGSAEATQAGVQVHGDTGVSLTLDLTAAAFGDATGLIERLVADGSLAPHAAASVLDRLAKANASTLTFNELYAIGYVEQAIARANNQIKGDAADTAVRRQVVAQLNELITYLTRIHGERKAQEVPAAA